MDTAAELHPSGLPPIVPDRMLRTRWAPGRDRVTWYRWKRSGKVPAPDVTLPNGEAGWYRESVIAHETRGAQTVESRVPASAA